MIRRACNNLRDKALIETAYEGAFRPHELLGLKRSSVAFDDYGAKISIEKGKTGPRSVRVVNAAPLLAEWMEHHPLKAKDAPLWVDMSNDTTYQPLKDISYPRGVMHSEPYPESSQGILQFPSHIEEGHPP